MSRLAAGLKIPKKTTPAEWAKKNRVYPQTAGIPGPRDPWLTPFMVPLSNAVVSGKYSRAVAVTAAQSSKTDTALDIMGQRLDQRPAPILFVGPSVDFNRDQFEPRFKAMIEGSKTLKGKLLTGKREKKTLKIIAGVRVRLASGASSTALKSDPAAMAFIDEYDEMTANIRGQGDPLGLVEARGETYADFITLVTSTPSQGVVETEIDEVSGLEFWAVGDVTEISSPIWRLFQEGTRHHWAWPCPCCGEYFIPMRKHLSWEKGSTPAQANRSAHLVCPNSGCVIEEGPEGATKAEMNAKGVMIAPGQTVEDAIAERNVPDASTYSQWASGLCSPFVTWGMRAERMVKAEISGEDDKQQTAVNANFGELFTPGLSGDMPQWQELLENRTSLAPGEVTDDMYHLIMGVDVQKNGLFYGVRGFGSLGSSWLVDHGFLHGNTAEDQVWDDLQAIIDNPIGKSDRHVSKVLVDSGFRPDKPNGGSEHRVYQFARRNSWLVSAVKGRSTTGGTPYRVSKIEVQPDGKRRPYSLGLVLLDAGFFKSLVHSRVKTTLGQAGSFYLHNEADEEYARQVLSEVRTVTPGSGKPVWKKLRKDNHMLDVEALIAAGGYSLNVHRIPEKQPEEPDPSDDGETGQAQSDPDKKRPATKRQASRNRRSRLSGLGARMNR